MGSRGLMGGAAKLHRGHGLRCLQVLRFLRNWAVRRCALGAAATAAAWGSLWRGACFRRDRSYRSIRSAGTGSRKAAALMLRAAQWEKGAKVVASGGLPKLGAGWGAEVALGEDVFVEADVILDAVVADGGGAAAT